MFVIFGWGRRTRRDHGPVVPMQCPRCSNNVYYRWIAVKTWFSLFFIPVIPYGSKHFLVCPTCSNGRQLSRSQREHVAAMVPHTTRVLGDDGDPEAYARATADFWATFPGSEAGAAA